MSVYDILTRSLATSLEVGQISTEEARAAAIWVDLTERIDHLNREIRAKEQTP